MKKIILFGLVLLSLIVNIYAPFTITDFPGDQSITEDVPFSFDVNVSVNESLVNYSLSDPTYSIFNINPSTGVISFTLSNNDILEHANQNGGGTYDFFIVADNLSNSSDDDSEGPIEFTLVNVNDAPVILDTNPNTSYVEIQENSSDNFNFSFTDIDITDDSMRYEWYIDGVLNSTSSIVSSTANTAQASNILTYSPNLTSEGIHTITISVNDTFNAETNYTWTVNVTKFDVPPVIDVVDPLTNITINESDSYAFYANFSDFDNDAITANWFLDGNPVQTNVSVLNSTYNFTTNFTSEGNYTILLNITSDTKWDSHVWGIEVLNTNIAPNITLFKLYNESLGGLSIYSPSYNFTLAEISTYDSFLNFTSFDLDNNLANYTLVSSQPSFSSNGTLSGNNIITNLSLYTSTIWGNISYNLTIFDTDGLNDTIQFNVYIVEDFNPNITYYINVTNASEGDTVLFGFNTTDNTPNLDPPYSTRIYKDGQLLKSSCGNQQYECSVYENITFNYTDSGIRNITYYVQQFSSQKTLLYILVNVSNVNLAPNVTGEVSNSPINEGETFYLNFTGSDFDSNLNNYSISENGTIISTGSFTNNNSELIQFNKTYNFSQSGNYTYDIFVYDSDLLNDTFQLNITVIDNLAPVIDFFTNISSINENVNQTFTFNYSDINDNIFSSYIYLNGTLQNNSNITTIEFNQTSAGTYNLTYLVNDTEGLSDSISIIFQVNETNFAPMIDTITYPNTINEGELFNITFNATDVDNNIANYSIFRNGTLVNTSNIFYWQTNFTNSGNWNFTFIVNDTGGLNDTQSELITIIDNIAPNIFSILNVTMGFEGGSSFVGFNANDTNDNIDSYIIYLDGILEDSQNQTTISWGDSDEGLHNVTYFVNDSEGLSDNITIVINVTNTNLAPVISNITSSNSYTIQEGTSTLLTILATDVDLNIDSYELYQNGTLVSSSSSYLFNLSSNYTSAGTYNFSANVNDTAGLDDNFSIILTVIDNVNPQITTYTDNSTISEGQSINVSFNATDNNSNIVSYSIFRNGTLEANNDDTVLYFNFTSNGIWNITYLVTDDEGLTGTQTIFLNITDVNDIPILNFTNSSINVSEDLMTNVSLSNFVFDEDDSYSQMNFSCSDNMTDINVSTIFNNVTNFLEVSTNNSFTGFVGVTCTVYDRALASDTDSFTMQVTNLDNDAPVISNYTPTNLTLSVNETDTLNFTHVSSDIENNNLTYSWQYNGVEFNNTQNASFYFNYTTAGIQNISIIVSDNFSAQDIISWQINVTDINRASSYGTINDLFEERFTFSDVVNLTTNATTLSIYLSQNGTNYSLSGYAISDVFTDGLLDYKISLNYTENVSNGTTVNYYIRTGPTLTVGASWTEWQEISLTDFNDSISTDDTFFQYKINMTTNNTLITPTVTELSSRYTIGDKSSNKNTQVSNWLDLDDFFSDIDTDNTFTYTIVGDSSITFTVNGVTNQLTFNPDSGFIGTETIYIIANDGTENVSSDNITFTILDVVSETPKSGGSSGGGGGGSKPKTITKTVEVEVPVEIIKSFELVLPKPILDYNQTKVVVPFLIENTLNKSIKSINVTIAGSNITLNLSNLTFFIDSLEPGEKRYFNVTVNNPDKVDSYYLNISAESEEFGYSDTGKVFIQGIAKEQDPDFKATSTRIDYAQEFLLQNQDCIELIEQISVAQEYMLEGEFDEANLHVEKIINGCTRIVEGSEEIDFDDIVGKYEKKKNTFQNYWQIFIIILVILLLIPVFTSIKKYFSEKVFAKKKNKDEFDDYLKKLE